MSDCPGGLMADAELDAAGITDPTLRRAYAVARRLHATHGRTYFLATRLLPARKRPYVHALYAFARYADDLVDERGGAGASARLAALRQAVTGGAAGGEPVVRAVRDTVRRFDLPTGHLADFLDSMRADLTVTDYPTYDDLAGYMWGSGAVIGLLLLPVLGTAVDRDVAAPYAADLGIAFQLTNFVRDVGEDLRRGRVYLPGEDLAAFGVDRDRLARGAVDRPVRRLLAHEIARTRAVYRSAEPGIGLLAPDARPCVRAAFRLYGAILDEIERADYRVLDRRVTVPAWRRAILAAPALGAAVLCPRSRRNRGS